MKYLIFVLIFLSTYSNAMMVRKVTQTHVLEITTPIYQGSYSTSMIIPADSVVTDSWIMVMETIVSNSQNKISMECETENDLVSPFVFSDKPVNFIESSAGGLAKYFFSDGCTVLIKVGSGFSGLTDGKILISVEYMTKDVLN